MVKKKRVKRKGPKDPWFKRRDGNVRSGWGFGPINWEGWVALLLLIGVNVFAANYFDVMNAPLKDVSKFLVVFLLSIVVFILIAKRKTKGVEVPKNGG